MGQKRNLLLSLCFYSSIIVSLSACNEESTGSATALDTNHAPSISGTPTAQAPVGSVYSFTPNASDPDNDELQFSISNAPRWATFNSSTGALSGTPQSGDTGTYSNIQISVSDANASASLEGFSIAVSESPVTPPPQQQAAVMVSYNSNFANAIPLSGATLNPTNAYFFVQEGSDWSSRGGVNRVNFYCCKTANTSHTQFPADTSSPYSISVDLSQYPSGVARELYADVFFNNQVTPDSFTVNFTIASSGGGTTPQNNAPTITGTPTTSVNANSAYGFVPIAGDADGDSLTFSITNRPTWASFNSSTGALTGTPSNSNAGVYSNIRIAVSDGLATTLLPQFSITVAAVTNNVPPVASFSANPTSGVASLTVNFSATQDNSITEYRWNFGDGNTALGPTQTHIYSQAGTYSATLTVTNSVGTTATTNRTINVLSSVDNSGVIVPQGVLFYDDFDYAVGRDSANASDIFVAEGGWRWAKTQQDYGSGNGYLYTVNSIPGYSGTFPGRNSSRVLAMEARPATLGGQTDFYLQYGDTDFPTDTVPGDVWFQYWLYPARTANQPSQFHWRNKFIYPCNGAYACTSGKWIVYQGYSSASPFRDELSDGSLYAHVGDSRVGSIVNSNDPDTWWRDRPGQSDLSENIAVNRWTLVKIHVDTTHTSGNSFEMWLKPMGGQWIKVAEWIGGVTPGFQWTIPADQVGGHRVFRMPTTMPGGGTDPLYDSWVYMDDFTMTTSEDTLPIYPY